MNKNQSSGTQPEKKNSKLAVNFSAIWQDKKLRSLFLSLCVVLFCAILYLVLHLTVLRPAAEEELPTIGNHGETMQNGRPFVIEPIEANGVLGIRVENEFGGFYYYLAEDGQYYFEGAESMLYQNTSDWASTSYEDLTNVAESMSIVDSLFGLSRYMLASSEVEGFDPQNLAAYGLDNGGKAKITVTFKNETGGESSQTVFIGNKTVSGGAYYVMPEGREAVYILTDTFVTRCIFTDITSYLSPLVAPQVPTASYADVTTFTLSHHGRKFLSIRELSEEEKKENGDIFTHTLTFPNAYYPADSFQTVLEGFTDFRGESVCEYNISIDRLDDSAYREEYHDMFRRYNLLDEENQWVHELSYAYESEGFETDLYISEKLEIVNENAAAGDEKEYIYYVYSPVWEVIALFKAEDLAWLEWDLLDFVDNHAFVTTIDSVSTISFSYGTTTASFRLEGDGNALKVTSSNGVPVETDNFRQLYKAILFTTIDGYATAPQENVPLLTIRVVLENGDVNEYSYYAMTARKAYYVLNGSGEFYVNRDYVKQLITACDGILKGEKITVDYKN